MKEIIKDRMTIIHENEFVVFLIGMRINKLWKVHKWLPVAFAMKRIITELKHEDNHGLLSGEYRYIGNPTLFIQYWRSYDDLEKYAASKNLEHKSAWKSFFKAVALNGDVGIWHETYVISPDKYESVYLNMPPFGLGRTGELVPASGLMQSSRGRLKKGKDEHLREVVNN